MGTCIPYAGCLTKGGYGWRTVKGVTWLAHRYAWVLNFGSIPDGQVVRHKCDNRSCVNPEHLELGTQMDNIHDALERGRFPLGADRTTAKLSSEVIAHCKSVYKNRCPVNGTAALAKLYSVNQSTMSRALSGRTYNV